MLLYIYTGQAHSMQDNRYEYLYVGRIPVEEVVVNGLGTER